MSRHTNVFHRAAVAIHERQCLFDGHPSLSPPTESWSECYRLTRLIEKARRRNLSAAVSRMEAALTAAIRRVTTALHDYERAAVARDVPDALPTTYYHFLCLEIIKKNSILNPQE